MEVHCPRGDKEEKLVPLPAGPAPGHCTGQQQEGPGLRLRRVCVFAHAHCGTALLPNPTLGGESRVLPRERLFLLTVTSPGRSQLKVVEETYGQREEKLRQEKEQLAAQLLSQSQDAEQAQAELVAQHQQRLAALEQQNTLELERVRELQR